MNPTVIYFIQAGDLIKIGFTRKLRQRFLALERMSSVPITCLGFVEGTMQTERSIHREFSALRAHGEWFRGDDRLLVWIQRNALALPLPPSGFVHRSRSHRDGPSTAIGRRALPQTPEAIEAARYVAQATDYFLARYLSRAASV